MNRANGAIVLLLVSAFLASCASMPFDPGKEPKIIAIRNLSGADIDTVTLREASRSSSRSTRFGSISPVPAGLTQVLARSSSAPALPRTIAVEWVDSANVTRVKEVSLTKAFRSATGAVDEALVFEFGENNDVLVLVEILSQ